MSVLLPHDGASFDDQVVFLTGNAYRNCAFNRCTMVIKGFPFQLDACSISGCIWHLDLTLHDENQTLSILKIIQETVLKSLPKAQEG